ncbi:MAG: 50S ribosomal protein L6 [Deltaproteobacteria bacterium]|nr:50S ribosomal protein L6 [Deltaproteobacteria bacterium]
MSRTGKRPIALPEKVKARLAEGRLFIEGPLGKNDIAVNAHLTVNSDSKQILITRNEETRQAREVHGMFRSLVQNIVSGVSEGFKKVLDIEGVGYRAEMKGNALNMTLGFSHPVVFELPPGIKVTVEKQTKLTLSGSDKTLLGQVTANIRGLKPPEPYKGKGIRYEGEHIERKVGKAAATAGGGGAK